MVPRYSKESIYDPTIPDHKAVVSYYGGPHQLKMSKGAITKDRHGMEILCAVCTQKLVNRILNSKLIYCTRSAVNLAHKIHGPETSNAPIIVLHGLLGSKRNWESMSKKLVESTGTRVVAVDLRNHGESPHESSHTYPELAADVSQLMTNLNIPEATIIGHSMGGRTAMVFALTEPSKIRSLIIVDISPMAAGTIRDFFPRLIDAMGTVKFPTGDLNTVANAKGAAKHKLLATGAVEDNGAMQLVLMNVGKRYDKKIGWMCNVEALKKHFPDIATFPLAMIGKKFEGPTLFLAGENSNFVPPSELDKIRNFFPQAQLHYVPGAGHNVHIDNPVIFLNMAVTFLKASKAVK